MRLTDDFNEKLWLAHKEHLLKRSGSSSNGNEYEVHPVIIRKTPKFPSRERHMAIRRKKPSSSSTPSISPQNSIDCDCTEIKTCQSCKCPREAHAIYQEQVTSVRERLGFKLETEQSRIEPRQLGYTWVPPGIMTSSKVQRYFDKIPQDKVPKIGSTGERYRERQLVLQLPRQDLALDYCKNIEPEQRASYEDFVAARNEIALDIGYIKDAPQTNNCQTCDERINKGDMAVIAPKFVEQMMWHPKCFACSTCDELLVDLTYCVHDDKVYCERHYAEQLKPRCNACDEEPIKDDTTPINDGKSNETKNVSTDETYVQVPLTLADKIALASAFDINKTPQETEEVACNQPFDHSESHSTGSALRRSPRMDEIDHYEERWEQEERRKSSSLTSAEQQSNETTTGLNQIYVESDSVDRRITPDKIEVKITYEPILEQKDSATVNKSPTPSIEIDYALDDDSNSKKVILEIEEDTTDDYDDDSEQKIPTDIMAGLSDFYDFNASINPTYSRSTSLRRSRSADLSQSAKPKSPVTEKIEEPYKFVKRSPSPGNSIRSSPPKIQDISFLNNFYDFNVNLNQQAYNRPVDKIDKDTHRDSIDLIINDLENLHSQYKSHNLNNMEPDTELILQIERLKNDIVEIRDVPTRPKTPNNLSPITPETPEYPSNLCQIAPLPPDYPRSFSTELKDVEKLKDEMITGAFKRSTYVGESADFSDDFEELREQTRNFLRSQSKSRSPNIICDDFGIQANRNAAKKELQERILEQITKTTVDFQDFSQNLTQQFLEHERRVSDSALIIQKPEILIQFEDDLDDLEPEEYHHFRRFSIQQEDQIEEYPIDDVIFVDQIEMTTVDGGTETWQRDDTYTSEDKGAFSQMGDSCTYDDKTVVLNYTDTVPTQGTGIDNSSEVNGAHSQIEENVSDEYYISNDKGDYIQIEGTVLNNTYSSKVDLSILEETNTTQDDFTLDEIIAEIEELEEESQNNASNELHETDSNSSDDRQTIVEVDDGIDVDVLDYNEQTEESYNEQSECEEYERTIDRYANSTINDWKEEGAVGGIIDEEFDQMYDEAIRDRKQSGIQRDYDGIIENITDEKNTDYDDSTSIRTEDLLEEILKADEEKYGWSLSRASSKESIRSILDGSEHRYLGDAVSQSISSTRLRSRYGLPPATGSYANFENLEDIDMNYKPKREYNWRKNFKIDDDDNDDDKNNNSVRVNNRKYKQSYNNNVDVYDDTANSLNSRKYSLGGESITLFSRSPENDEDLQNVPEENINEFHSDDTFFREENEKNYEELSENNEKKNIEYMFSHDETATTEEQLEEIEKLHKKKKPKKKLRKGSKGGLYNDDENSQSRRESLIDTEIPDNINEAPKRKKKKRRIQESISIDEDIQSEINVAEKLSDNIKVYNNPLTISGDKKYNTTEKSSYITPLDSTEKLESAEQITSQNIKMYDTHEADANKEAELINDSVSQKSIESINSPSNSISTLLDISEKSQKLDKIESSDIKELIKDSSILGSSF